MPEDYELYYGFTRLAIELNEILPDEGHLLPPTDSRFRPDQRYVELLCDLLITLLNLWVPNVVVHV